MLSEDSTHTHTHTIQHEGTLYPFTSHPLIFLIVISLVLLPCFFPHHSVAKLRVHSFMQTN